MTTGVKRPVEATKEDLQFILDHGGSREEAAKRLGFPNRKALEKWLRDHRGE